MRNIKIGIFGLFRGSDFLTNVLLNDGIVVAVCDRNEEEVKRFLATLPHGIEPPAVYSSFDAFIEHPMDAVILANHFPEHAPYAVRCLEKNIHVLSECIANGTMAEGVELVRAAQKSQAFYMLSENYPFIKHVQELRRVYQGGTLGKFLYAEGEYAHPSDGNNAKETARYNPYPKHWRNYCSATYYISHSLAPLMYTTGAFPVRVTAMGIFSPYEEYEINASVNGDRAAVVTCLNDDDSVYKVTGCANWPGKDNSYRFIGTRGKVESLRGTDGQINLHYSAWCIPEGLQEKQTYPPQWPEDIRVFAEKAGHGGGDYFVVKEFFHCIRTNTKPIMDEYFATTCASVGILAHRSMLERGVPYDIPDFHKEEDLARYENDRLSPFYAYDQEPTLPSCSRPDYQVPEEKFRNYLKALQENA